MINGYMTSSKGSRTIAAQLRAANCEKIRCDFPNRTGKDRPQRQRAIASLSPGDVLVVTQLQQFADSTLDLLAALGAISEKQASFRSLAEPWVGISQPNLGLMTVLLGLTAFERTVRSARTTTGQAGAIARGVKLGRKPKLTPKQEQDALRRRKRGETLAAIAEIYHVSHSTISRLAG